MMTWNLDRDAGVGHWVTIDGTHVYIKDGRVAMGPKALMGRTLSSAHEHVASEHDKQVKHHAGLAEKSKAEGDNDSAAIHQERADEHSKRAAATRAAGPMGQHSLFGGMESAKGREDSPISPAKASGPHGHGANLFGEHPATGVQGGLFETEQAKAPVAKEPTRGSPAVAPAKLDESTGLPLNKDGTVTVYHHTSSGKADAIRKSGRLKADAEPDVYVTTHKDTDTGYGDTAVPLHVKPESLSLDDEFPNGRKDFRISVGKPGGSISVKVGDAVPPATLESAHAKAPVDPSRQFGLFAKDASGNPVEIGEKPGQANLFDRSKLESAKAKEPVREVVGSKNANGPKHTAPLPFEAPKSAPPAMESEKGKGVKVYHGTQSEFDSPETGSYWTTNKNAAGIYARGGSGTGYVHEGFFNQDGAKVKDFGEGSWNDPDVKDYLVASGKSSENFTHFTHLLENDQFRDHLASKGYDAFRLNEESSNPGDNSSVYHNSIVPLRDGIISHTGKKEILEKLTKQPYEKTWAEYAKSQKKSIDSGITTKTALKNKHSFSVSQAVKSGKNLRDEVLADYPNLRNDGSSANLSRLDLDRSDLTGGECRTIEGSHVYIHSGTGEILAGPAHLQGKKVKNLIARSKPMGEEDHRAKVKEHLGKASAARKEGDHDKAKGHDSEARSSLRTANALKAKNGGDAKAVEPLESAKAHEPVPIDEDVAKQANLSRFEPFESTYAIA